MTNPAQPSFGRKIHIVGIGGAGMSSIARYLLQQGERVSGSDRQDSAGLRKLAQSGARVQVGHRAENIADAGLVVISSAVTADNPELQQAHRLGLPVFKRAQFLEIMLAGRSVVAVAGSAGKTTTTGWIAFLLDQAGRQPGYIIGSDLLDLGSNGAAGAPDAPVVVEADEYDHMFLGLRPQIAVVTNISWDHPDLFPTVEAYQQAFVQFTERIQPGGLLLTCADDAGSNRLAAPGQVQRASYGLSAGATWQAREITHLPEGGSRFTLYQRNTFLADAEISLPGEHNVCNSLAAIATGQALGLDLADLLRNLKKYRGTGRRFEIKSEMHGIIIVDDYAHHPAKLRATLRAARQRFPGRIVWALFQPHTFSRTKALLDDFAQAFAEADHVVVVDIFPARERDDGTVHSRDLVARMQHPSVQYVPTLREAVEYLAEHVMPGHVVLTLGAGDVTLAGAMLRETIEDGRWTIVGGRRTEEGSEHRLSGQKPRLEGA